MPKVVCAVAALLAFACGGSSNAQGPQTVFTTALSGANETPPPGNSSAATGTATFTVDGGTMAWTASSSPLNGKLSGFHIHLADAGVAGSVVVTLTGSLSQALDKGTDGGGSFTAPDTTAKNADGGPMSFDDLVQAMRDGHTYVNMHDTPTYPGGEIRGQLH
jgi:CHRD domain